MFENISRGKKLLFALIFVALLGAGFIVRSSVNGAPDGETATRDANAIPNASSTDEQKRALELYKLEQEVESLRISNEALSRRDKWLTTWLTAIGGILVGGFIPILVLILTHNLNRTLNETQKQKLEQERKLGREEQLLKVFNDLGDDKPTVRIGAIAVLVQRMRTLSELKDKADKEEKEDLRTIVSVLISASKHESEENIQKYIADGLAEGLNARLHNVGDTTAKALPQKSPLEGYDFQGAQLQNAWWYGIDARGVDFYKANLGRAGLRNAVLRGAVLKNANLTGATLSDADLSTLKTNDAAANDRKTDLQGAQLFRAKLVKTKLSGAKLGGANLGKANLTEAKLDGADLSEADLTGANLTGAIFDQTKLDGAKINAAAFALAIRKTVNVEKVNWISDDASPTETTAADAPPVEGKVITHTIDFGKGQQAVKIMIETGDGAEGIKTDIS
jgi:uncharacterized protein YjbI with pentapeptide repeats